MYSKKMTFSRKKTISAMRSVITFKKGVNYYYN